MPSGSDPTPRSLLDLAPGLSMLGCLTVGFVGLTLDVGQWSLQQDASIMDGAWATAVEATVDEHAFYKQAGIVSWTLTELMLFGDARPGALLGSDGWLYTDEEFQRYPDEDAELQHKLAVVEQVRDTLRAHGTELVVALIPAKARVHSEGLGSHRYPDYAEQRYERFRQGLEAKGITAPDLAGPLRHAAAGGEQVFLRTDTHWTPAGAQRVAREVASHQPVQDLGSDAYTTLSKPAQAHEGDLLRYLPLGPLQSQLGPPPDSIAPTTGQAPPSDGQGGLGLFDDNTIPVTLVGTSYSAGGAWNFEAALEEALQADVLNAAAEGQGPMLPMVNYLQDDAFLQTPPRLVVWEFPERFIPVSYEGTD